MIPDVPLDVEIQVWSFFSFFVSFLFLLFNSCAAGSSRLHKGQNYQQCSGSFFFINPFHLLHFDSIQDDDDSELVKSVRIVPRVVVLSGDDDPL